MYESLEATLHDTFWNNEADADESPLLMHFLEQHPGTALEVGCGSGRLLLPLLALGYAVEGVEISSDMVELLRTSAAEKGLAPIIHHCPIEDYDTSQRYSAVTIPAFTLQLLSRDQAKQTLKQLRQLVDPDGGLYLSLFIPWAELLDELEIDVWHLDKEATLDTGEVARCYTRHGIDRLNQELHREHRYEVGTHSHRSEQTLQWYFLPEIKQLLALSGWELTNYDTDFQLSNQDPDGSTLTIYATASSTHAPAL